MDANMMFIVVMVVVLGGMMWFQSKKSKEQQQKVKDFRANLQPGTEVITIGQIIGKVVSVDEQYEEIVIDSEGTLLRFGFNGIAREYVRPAYVSDDEVDEDGNPLPQDETEQAQEPMDVETVETSEVSEAASAAEAETETRKAE